MPGTTGYWPNSKNSLDRCLAITGNLEAITDQLDETFRIGKASFDGISKQVNRTMVPEAKVGDYVSIASSKEEVPSTSSTRYDFSDLAGKLEWQGDAVRQQRLMRDEWQIFA